MHGMLVSARDPNECHKQHQPLAPTDRTGERFFHLTVWWSMTILGYIISLTTMLTAARYFSLFLMAVGYSGVSCTLSNDSQ